jgi:hypothetical protein
MGHNQFTVYILAIMLSLCIGVDGQNIFVVEKAGGGGIRMFRENDQIKVKTRSTNVKIGGRINMISDSSLIINFANEVMLNDIEAVYRTRWGFNLLQKICLASGILYLSLSTLNGVINNDSPIVPDETLKIGGGLLIGGVLLTPLTTRTHRIEQTKWKVKILDFTD